MKRQPNSSNWFVIQLQLLQDAAARRQWGRRASPLITWGVLTLLAAWPIILGGPPTTIDAPNHFYRLVELNWHAQHGDLYPRWFSDINYGLGGPLLNYYPPLAYYPALLLHVAVGVPLSSAFQGSFILAVSVAALGMFLWAANHFRSPTAGIVASAGYVLTPYLYTSILIRGALPEMWALAISPWLLWSVHRLEVGPSGRIRVLVTLFYAALILTHTISLILITPIMLAYAFSLLPRGPSIRTGSGGRLLGTLAVCVIHAVAISACYLLPSFFESSYVDLLRVSLDYGDQFVPLDDLFSLPIPFDPYLVHNRYPPSLPLPQIGLAIAAAVAAYATRRRANRIVIAVFLALTAAYAFLSTEASAAVWQRMPLGNLLQFPWRMLGPATMILAWLAGAAASEFHLKNYRLVAVAVMYFYSLTWSYRAPSSYQYPDSDWPGEVIEYEIRTPVAIGLTYQQEFLPRWVAELPPPDTMLPRYQGDGFPSRLGPLPPDVSVDGQQAGLTSAELHYRSPAQFTAMFNVIYFPGWTATLDGRPVAIEPTTPHGLIGVRASPGQHSLRVALKQTSIQLAGLLITGASLLALLVVVRQPESGTYLPAPERLSPWYAVVFAGLIVLRIIVLDRFETPFSYTRLRQVPNPPSQKVGFGQEQLALIGIEYPEGTNSSADEPVRVTLYWQAVAALSRDYHISLQLVDRNGSRFGQSDQYPGLVATGGWQPGQYLRDEHRLMPLPGTPPGDYRLLVSVYTIEDGAVSLLEASVGGALAGVEYEAATVKLGAGWQNAPGPLNIVEASLAGESFGVGDVMPFTMIWSSGPMPPQGLEVLLQVADRSGREVFSTRFLPAGADYPPDQWLPNQLIRYPHSVILPADIPAGPARLTLTFVGSEGIPIAQPFELGTVTITVPEHSFVMPPMGYRVDHAFGDTMRLLGYDLSSESLTLYWQALKLVPMRLTVFVHQFDRSGAFVGGHDSPPWRTTTSWLPGEVITDVRPAPEGNYFEIGLYDSLTGERFGEPLIVRP